MKKLAKNVELIPHIDIDLNYFRTGKKRSLRKIKRKEKLAYWEETFQQIGVEGIQPLTPEKWVVAVRDIQHDQLFHYLLKQRWNALSKAEDVWQVFLYSTAGGISLKVDDKILYPAMCCSDFSNLEEWRNAVTDNNKQWEMLWNGHPWLYSRHQDSAILLTALTEKDAPPDNGKFTIEHQYLKQLVTSAEKDLNGFKDRIVTYWNENKSSI